MNVCMYVCLSVGLSVCMYIYIYIYIYACIYIYIYTSISLSLSLYIYIYIHIWNISILLMELSIESLEEYSISRWSLEVLSTILLLVSFEIETLASSVRTSQVRTSQLCFILPGVVHFKLGQSKATSQHILGAQIKNYPRGLLRYRRQRQR